MNSDHDKEAETARTSTNSQPSSIPAPARLMQPPPPDAPLSEGIRCFLLRQEQEGAAELTLAEYRGAAWSLLEFLGLDPPLRELNRETAARWLDWLRTTPAYRRSRGAYPKHFTRQAVSDFFREPPPKNEGVKMRGAETVAKYCRQGCRLLRWLNVPVEVERRKRKRFRRLPPIVPKFDAIAGRWKEVLASPAVPTAQRRQIVLTQALLLLWGTRLAEGLTASLDDVEGHWSLVVGKTGMRINYLNSQALGIVQALRGQLAWSWAAETHTRISGWPWSLNTWHSHVRECGVDDGEKPQQDLRKRFATWVRAKDPEVEMLLAGHGGGVIFDHYLDVLERVPGVMEQFELPQLDGFTWPAPVYLYRPAGSGAWTAEQEAKATAALTPPKQLYARFDRWLEEQERRAAG